MKNIISHFNTIGDITEIVAFGSGHIHCTYLVKAVPDSYILQQINTRVFRDPVTVMNNISQVTGHIRRKLLAEKATDLKRSVLTIVPLKNGAMTYTDEEKRVWRCFEYIPGHKTYDRAASENQVYEGGKAYGKFLNQLSDLPAKNLGETIRGFHDMEMRIRQFDDACKNGAKERITETTGEIQLLRDRKDEMLRIQRLGREGKISTRIVHHDTKINNVLFDENGKGLCVIDLDTVMPGFVHDDFGDSIRTFTNTGEEDDMNLDNVSIDMNYFKAYSEGFLGETRNVLNDIEKDHLALSARALTYMQSLRFLTDYLNGDIYYHVLHDRHNLQRTRAQIKLLLSMEEHFEEMKSIIHNLA